jgi:hypothetical protein
MHSETCLCWPSLFAVRFSQFQQVANIQIIVIFPSLVSIVTALLSCVTFAVMLSLMKQFILYFSLSLSLYLSIYLSIYLHTYLPTYGSTALLHLGRFFSFLIYTQSIGLLEWGISPSQRHYLHTEQHKQNKHTQTSMPWMRFEPMIPVFKRAKTVHTLDLAATVIGINNYKRDKSLYLIN